MRSLAVLLVALSMWVGALQHAGAQDRAIEEAKATATRIALLIGNSKYQQQPGNTDLKALKELNNACTDVERIAAVLESQGWKEGSEVIMVCDAKLSEIRAAVDQFKDAYFSGPHTLGFIYYAGHGLQIGSETYLFGVDAVIDMKKAANVASAHPGASVFKGATRLYADVVSQVGDAGAGSIFIVIDACRETPIDGYIRANPNLFRATQNYPQPKVGVKLLYSTAYGKLASDGVGAGSPFALSFEEVLKREGRINELVSYVVRDVSAQTADKSVVQIPDTTGSLNPPPPESCLTKC